VPITIRVSGDSLVHEPIVNEPPEIEQNLKQDNVDVEEEHIPPQESQDRPLKLSIRERRSVISNDYIMFL
jgi:hypothetical protein